jgi:hypothetical protein
MNATHRLNRDKGLYLVFHTPSGDVAATISLRMGSKEFLMKNFVNDYLDDVLEDEDVFERFGRKGKLPSKEGQRPRRGAQDAIKDKRRAREAEREQMTKDYIE